MSALRGVSRLYKEKTSGFFSMRTRSILSGRSFGNYIFSATFIQQNFDARSLNISARMSPSMAAGMSPSVPASIPTSMTAGMSPNMQMGMSSGVPSPRLASPLSSPALFSPSQGSMGGVMMDSGGPSSQQQQQQQLGQMPPPRSGRGVRSIPPTGNIFPPGGVTGGKALVVGMSVPNSPRQSQFNSPSTPVSRMICCSPNCS